MKNIFNLNNIEVKLIIPLIIVGGFFTSTAILLGLITCLILLFNVFIFLRTETLVKFLNVVIFLFLLTIYHYEIIIPVYNILMLCVAIKVHYSKFIKYNIMATLLFCLTMLIVPIDIKIKCFNVLCLIIYLFINRKYFQKWNIKNLHINNIYYKIMTYISLLFLFGMNMVDLYRKANNDGNVGHTLEAFSPLIISQILYIVIYPLIKKEVYIQLEKKDGSDQL